MADDTVIEVAKHVGGAGAGGGLMAMAMQWFRTREAREARDALIALQGKVDRLVADVEKMSGVSADVTRTADKASAAHDRLDGHEDRIAALEQKAYGAAPAPARRRKR